MKRAHRVIGIAAAVLFTSCIGVKTDITIKDDLSGTARVDYTVSRSLLDSGTLDGNERWPAVPVGKADFERAVSRIEGLTLHSYRERDAGGDRVFEVTLAFDHVSALAGFLSASGQQFAYTREGSRHDFTVLFHTPANKTANETTASAAGVSDDDLAALVQSAFSGYRFDFTIAVPGDTKTYSVPMSDLLNAAQQERLEISF